MTRLKIDEEKTVELATPKGSPRQVHVFEKDSIKAVNAAIAAKRPLLVRGEPGTGKTQLARAAAKELGWAFVSSTIDSRSEASDLLYHFDAVTRIGNAQIAGALGIRDEEKVRALLNKPNFIHPGPVWWAFDWGSALEQATRVNATVPVQHDEGDAEKGCVLLIDEIDKADPDLPNGLLEAFGSGSFKPEGLEDLVERKLEELLVIITTNEERALPDAFLRRCLVLQLSLPTKDLLVDFFIKRGGKHFRRASKEVLREAAILTRADREHWQKLDLAAPGLAEYLDLVRAVTTQEKRSVKRQLALLEEIAKFTLKKHPEA